MGPLFLLFIDLILAAIVAAFVAGITTFLVMYFAPPRVVRVLAQIEVFDVHPRHVCRGDTVNANWLGYADSGNLKAANLGGFPPFHREDLVVSGISIRGDSSFPADTDDSFEVTLELSRRSTGPVTGSLTITNHSSPNARIPIAVPVTFTRDPRPGWIGTRQFFSNPSDNIDDWSPNIQVVALEYPEALGPPGGPRPTRDVVRDVVVTWNGEDQATLTTDDPRQPTRPFPPVLVVGEWTLFVVARPGEGPDTLVQSVTIDLIPQCLRR